MSLGFIVTADFVYAEVTVAWLRRQERLRGSANQRKINSVYTRVLMMNKYSFLCSWKIIQLVYPVVINSLYINQLLTQWCFNTQTDCQWDSKHVTLIGRVVYEHLL